MKAHQRLQDLPHWLVCAFVVVTMMALGMALTIPEIVQPLYDLPLTVKEEI